MFTRPIDTMKVFNGSNCEEVLRIVAPPLPIDTMKLFMASGLQLYAVGFGVCFLFDICFTRYPALTTRIS